MLCIGWDAWLDSLLLPRLVIQARLTTLRLATLRVRVRAGNSFGFALFDDWLGLRGLSVCVLSVCA